MSKTKSKGKVNQKPPRSGKRLGVKKYGKQKIKVGEIILRQRGSEIKAGTGTAMGRDHTIYAIKNGVVKFSRKQGKKIVSVF